MDVRRLELLRELAERGSITEVARATHRTPSAVSQQLRVLEREAGLPLTEKAGRGIVLTDAGRALARSATDVAIALERADALWDEFRHDPTGEVSLATFPTGGQMLLPGVLHRLARQSGLTLHASDRDPVSEGFPDLANDFDIVLAHAPTRPPSLWHGRGLSVIHLITEPLDVALAPGHPLAAQASVSPADLIGEQWIGVPWGYPFERTLYDISAAAGAPVDIVQRFADTRVTESLVAAGLGIAILPRYTAGGAYLDSSTASQRIVLKPLSGMRAERHIYALMRPDRAERLAVRTVAEFLRAEAEAIRAANPAPA
ncbi:LysR family transcriptional regulator [Subtercola boreus]|uniref:LysR family transcriptional regulator n=1 Tax=Subtercola boreus TaxID=120213 RepID=A0A3E0WCX8_9MICO|nr:LysR family transcriptional regulator [Subtercola boreus]RFA22410.1 LysR family transcriptional regulator [Subtercola boreus]RFA22472.1 LysR family transcriptional regulator [Subtercola boreus]RFA28487.1 LysR family transcriptional regulator [Subtercola boreus]